MQLVRRKLPTISYLSLNLVILQLFLQKGMKIAILFYEVGDKGPNYSAEDVEKSLC